MPWCWQWWRALSDKYAKDAIRHVAYSKPERAERSMQASLACALAALGVP